MPSLHYLKLNHVSIYEQLKIEEALFRVDGRNWLILNSGSAPAVVLGISGNAEKMLNLSAVDKSGIPVIRRFSGGGTVVVDSSTLFISFIFQKTDCACQPFPHPIMQWTEGVYRKAIGRSDFALRENDYVLGEFKFGGNAQSIAKDRWVHHTSILWDYRSDMMAHLKLPEKQPCYRSGRPHEAFLCRLKDYLPSTATLFDGILRELSQSYTLIPADPSEIIPILTTEHRRSTRALSHAELKLSLLNQF